MEQNREPRNKLKSYSQLVFDKGGRSIKWRKNSLFNKWRWEIWTDHVKKGNSITNLHHTQKYIQGG